MEKLVLVLFFAQMIIGTLCVDCSNENQCCKPWQLIYEVNSNGARVSGNKQALLGAILAGSRIKVSFIGSSYYAEADGAFVYGGHAHAELLQSVSKSSWKNFRGDAYWWWTMLSTNGKMQNIRYNVGSNVNRGSNTRNHGSKWFIKTAPSPVYSNDKAGKATSGDIQALKDAVKSGNEIRAITNGYYSFDTQNIAYSGNKVVGQFLDHVSKKKSGNTISYQDKAYWWFTMISTTGKRDMSRWAVGSQDDRGHTSDTVSTQWFKDGCWEQVYSHDSDGKALNGALKDLVAAVQSGKRIRFQFTKSAHYTAEADNLSVRNGHVTAQALKHVSKASLETFQDNAYWYWLMVSTTGTVRQTMYNVGEHVKRDDSKFKYGVTWFVETRPWKLAYAHKSNGRPTFGSKANLLNAIKNGASVRITHENGDYAFPASNLALSGSEVAAQNVNHVSMQTATDNRSEMQIQSKAYWWFTIVTTRGERDMSRWKVGVHKSVGRNQNRVGLKWFVQE